MSSGMTSIAARAHTFGDGVAGEPAAAGQGASPEDEVGSGACDIAPGKGSREPVLSREEEIK